MVGGASQKMDNDFRIDGGNKNGPPGLQFVSDTTGVYQVSVMGDGDTAASVFHSYGLRVSQLAGSSGGIAHMTDGYLARQFFKSRLVKNVRN